MSVRPILDIKDLHLYFKFQNTASTSFFSTSTTNVGYVPTHDFFKKNNQNSSVLDELEISRKQLMKEAKNYVDMMKIIDGVNLIVYEKKNMGIIGESGCGKTTLIHSIFNFPNQHLKFLSGKILYFLGSNSVDLLTLPENDMRELRGTHFGLIPQMARESINPWLKLGLQTGEILKDKLSQKQDVVKEKILEYMGKVALPDPTIKIDRYVHQLSGGEAQKLCIAMALIATPRLVLADEILASLDMISQGQVIELLRELNKNYDFQYIFTTHNIVSALSLSETIAVMYAGEIIEVSPVSQIINEPLHPYTQGLIGALPWVAMRRGTNLKTIEGEPPLPFIWPSGCRFSPRCEKAIGKCSMEKPPMFKIKDREVACWLYDE